MPDRPRIDLDGVALTDEANPHMVLAVFRYRTTEGLILLVPESADVLVPWDDVADAGLDLHTGQLRVRMTDGGRARQAWLRGARVLVGQWTDRMVMTREMAPRR